MRKLEFLAAQAREKEVLSPERQVFLVHTCGIMALFPEPVREQVGI
jgi:hypothetical protein